jgi:hypothetical protein
MKNSSHFEDEIALIEDENIARLVMNTLDGVPYFGDKPSSSTGKYHPAFAQGELGLVKHTKAAVLVAVSLMQLRQHYYIQNNSDKVIAALLLHDCAKYGYPVIDTYTKHEHPLYAARALLITWEQSGGETGTGVSKETLDEIYGMITTHMGQWTMSRMSKVVLPKPETALQYFCHQADYLVSRGFFAYDESRVAQEYEAFRSAKAYAKKRRTYGGSQWR